MVFSDGKWNNGREIQNVIKASAALDFITVRPFLKDSFNLFIAPTVGPELVDRLIHIYNEPLVNDSESQFLELAQRANANLAFWYGFDELSVSMSNNGAQQKSDGSYSGLYKYQARDLKNSYKNKGFNALDELLCFLECHLTDFPEFKDSDTYTQIRSSIVPDAKTINRFLPINSRLIFLRFRPHISFVEETRLVSFIGDRICVELRKELGKDARSDRFVSLIEKLQPVVIFLAASRLLKTAGSMTDRGLYFTTVRNTSGNDEEEIPADETIISLRARQYEQDAIEYLSIVNRFIQADFPEYYSGSANKTFHRDNYDKKIFVS